jgi:multiple sugar transport system substrate-binding protein
MLSRLVLLAAVLVLALPGAKAADIVVWWDKPWYAEEEEALGEVVAALEQETGKQVEVAFYPVEELPTNIVAALDAGQPPDLAYGLDILFRIRQWAFEDRLVDLSDAVGTFSNLFDPDALASVTLVNDRTGRRALYGLPIGRSTVHIHVWKSLLGRAGFTLDDIPREWGAFWSFWCDQVQPAVRKATGRDDIWGVGLNMPSLVAEPRFFFSQFSSAYGADYVSADGRLVIDEPELRKGLVTAVDPICGDLPQGLHAAGFGSMGLHRQQ